MTRLSVYASDEQDGKLKKDAVIAYLPEPDVMANKPRNIRAAAPIKEANNPFAHENYSKEGIDVSRYQGNIDWQAVVQDINISYAYLKATEGASLVDVTYRSNLEGAKKAGLKVGSYHFYRPNISIDEQFNNLTTNVKPGEQDLLPLIDIEHKGSVSEEKFISDLQTFLERVTKFYGKRPMLYTFHNFYNRHLAGKFKGYKWMIARYREDQPTLDDGQDYIIWQYTDKARINGIRGNVDRSSIMDGYTLSEIFF